MLDTRYMPLLHGCVQYRIVPILQPRNIYVLADLCLITAEHGFLYAQRLPRLWCLLAGLAESCIAGLSD